MDSLFRLISDLYVLDSTDSLYKLLWKSNLKQIRYLLFVIKKQNFTYWDANISNYNQYDSVISTVQRMEVLLNDYKKKSEIAILPDNVDAVEYNSVNAESIKLDYTTKFYKDYVIGNDGFYSIIIQGYINKFINIADKIP